MQLFYNGTIYTMNPAQPTVEAVTVGSRGRIRSVGAFDAFRTMTPGARRIDLAGRTLLPGFNDAHVHIWKLGLLLTVQVDARRKNAPDIPAIIRLFRERAAALPAGTWILGRGYNEVELPEGRHPTRADLDAASADHPIALTRTCGHVIAANSLALRLSGIDRDTPDPAGGIIERDEFGEPTGLLKETAMGLVTRAVPPYDDAVMGCAIRAATYHQLRLGITSATDPLLMPDHVRVYRQLDEDGDLAVRVNGLPIRRPDGGTETLPLPEMHRSDTLRIDTVKFFADGGLSSATAAVDEPYQTTGDRGVLRFETDELTELMWEAHDAGFRIATHAIGDRAIEQVIGVYETLHRRKPNTGLRHRIEHLGLPTADHLRRCAALNVIAVPQTVFLPVFGAAYRRYLSDPVVKRLYPVRAMLDAGLTVALSSDAPVVPDDNPLIGIKAALDRLDHAGQPIAPDQAITMQEALYAYTMGGAIASGDADNRGSLEPGKWADMIVLSADPFKTPVDQLGEIVVEQTYVGGQLVFERH
jgi:predicted amidohydrolase YtcJ